MSRRTKKLGIVATFGPRYGRSVKNKVKIVMESSRKKYHCPKCAYRSVKKISVGIWQCRHCNHKFTGGAFLPVSAFMKSKTLLFKKIEEMDQE